jgi:hypothetical protein
MICEPVAVAPKVAFDALGIGNTKGYELLNSGELESFYIGRSRRVVWQSVKRLAGLAAATPEAA